MKKEDFTKGVNKSKASYKAIKDTPALKDLLEYLEKSENYMMSVAKERVFTNADGEQTQLDNDSATVFLQRGAAFALVKQYIDSKLK